MRQSVVREGCVEISAENLKGAITLGGFKMEWLAERSGISLATLRRWKAGKIRCAQKENVIAVAQTMGIHQDALVLRKPSQAVG